MHHLVFQGFQHKTNSTVQYRKTQSHTTHTEALGHQPIHPQHSQGDAQHPHKGNKK